MIYFRLGYCNSCINPFLYGLYAKDFRGRMKKHAGWIFSKDFVYISSNHLLFINTGLRKRRKKTRRNVKLRWITSLDRTEGRGRAPATWSTIQSSLIVWLSNSLQHYTYSLQAANKLCFSKVNILYKLNKPSLVSVSNDPSYTNFLSA